MSDAVLQPPPIPEGTVFKNMEHAIVQAMHDLGATSVFHDNSVRTKDLFSRIEFASIEVGDHIESGPHRFSIFNSALSGRRSAAELFERIEDPNRQGAWWRLKKSYEDAITYAMEQKGFKKVQQRSRQRQEAPSVVNQLPVRPQPVFKWNKSEVLDILTQIKDLAHRTSSLREENRELESKLSIINEEISIRTNSLKDQNPHSDVLLQLELYRKAAEYESSLRQKLLNSQKTFMTLSELSSEYQK